MADFNKYFPFLNSWEGNQYENVKGDAGGSTKFGITLEDWKQYGFDINHDGLINADDVKLITAGMAKDLVKKEYWDTVLADQINDFYVAVEIVDAGYNQGIVTVIDYVQPILGITATGHFGQITLGKINAYPDKQDLLQKIKAARINRYTYLANKYPNDKQFYDGWIRRSNAIQYGKLLDSNYNVLP
jgi:lysozyme family protein